MITRPKSMLLFLIPGLIFVVIMIIFLVRDSSTPVLIMDTTFGAEQIITSELDGPKRVAVADLNGDGDLDILGIFLHDNQVAWFENLGDGVFGAPNVISAEISRGESVAAVDMDGDGDMDVLSASSGDGKIAWYENLNGLGTFGAQNLINPLAPRAYFVTAADLDADTDADVLYAAWDMAAIVWQKNPGGREAFEQVYLLTNQAEGASSVFAADLDGDGDRDVLATAALSNQVVWFENSDGYGNFNPPNVLSNEVNQPYAVIAADLDQDGDQDVLSASAVDNKIAWYENMDGLGLFGLQKIINDRARQAASVYAADLDNDGDLDVLSASSGDDTIAWYENDGTGLFGDAQVITDAAEFAFSVIAADLDNDGDTDVIATALEGDTISWFENLTPKSYYFPIILTSP